MIGTANEMGCNTKDQLNNADLIKGAKDDDLLNEGESTTRIKKDIGAMKGRHKTWNSELFDGLTDGSIIHCANTEEVFATEYDHATPSETRTVTELPSGKVKTRTSTGRRKKSRSEKMKKHHTWHEGDPGVMNSTEDDMIINIEDFIKEYVEQALDAEYFKRCTAINM